jgi:cyclopropane-fatty-acyl-phospholipid synthase
MDEYTRGAEPGLERAAVAIPFRVVDDAADVLARLFRDFNGPLTLRLWDGTTLRWEAAPNAGIAQPPHTLVFRNPEAVWALLPGRDRLRLAASYFAGNLDIEGDLFAALGLSEHLQSVRPSLTERFRALLTALRVRVISGVAPQSQARLHFDDGSLRAFPAEMPNDFYALWLDRAMVYSCAYFEQPDAGLDRAQVASLDHICRKLQLKPGDHLLDINCGWGALVIHAAKHYGVQAHGVTRNEQQLLLARQRIAAAGLDDRVTLERCDYGDLEGDARFDKVASVGILEHIGQDRTPARLQTVNRLLKPQGLFLNHGITLESGRNAGTPFSEFVNRFVFPTGQLETVSKLQSVMERAHFEIADVEALRSHYALTFRHWEAQLAQQHEAALKIVNESHYRIWRVYLAACAVEFESGSHGVYQVLACKRSAGRNALPLTRQYQYTVTSSA